MAKKSKKRRPWHRLFGLLLMDHLQGSPFVVELEMDLSRRKQLLDVVVVRREPGPIRCSMPDGLEDLAPHNLISFKSFQEPLDDWALKELTGHYVNYRKQVSPPDGELLPESSFQLIGVCARTPKELLQVVPNQLIQPGVYECQRGSDRIRIVVAGELRRAVNNSMIHLFSAAPEQIKYGVEHYRSQTAEDMSTIVQELFQEYSQEGVSMPYTMQDFYRDYTKKHLKDLTIQERLEGLAPEERLEGLPAEERVKGLAPEERVKGLAPEERVKGLAPEERVKGMTLEELEELLNRLKQQTSRKKKKGK